MSTADITLLTGIQTSHGKGNARLYYYQGNFFYPLNLIGKDKGRIRKAIRMFRIKSKALIATDRSHPDYKTKPELMEDSDNEHNI